MAIFFVDTNFFIQHRDAHELPWKEITADTDVKIIVPMAVQKELDRFKQDGNSRRARRARNLISLFRQIVHSDELQVAIKDLNPCLIVRLASPPSLNPERSLGLDLSQPDNCIIDEILAFTQENPSQPVTLLTGDISLIVKARHYGIQFIAIPETWLLEPEPDEEMKKRKVLEERIKELEGGQPNAFIKASAKDKCIIEVVTYEPLSATAVIELLEEVQRIYPMEKDFNFIPPRHGELIIKKYYPPKPEEIKEYQEHSYPDWVGNVGQYIYGLPNHLEGLSRRIGLTFELLNNGTRPAENLIVEFETLGDVQFFLPTRDKNDRAGFPEPPKAPKGKVTTFSSAGFKNINELLTLSPIPQFMAHQGPPKHDRYGFYWKDGRPAILDNRHAYVCDEFRHQQNAELFPLDVFVPKYYDPKGNNAVRCRVSASNQAKPFTMTLPVTIHQVRKKPEEDIRSFVHQYLRITEQGQL